MAESRAEAARRRQEDLADRVVLLAAYQAALGLSRLNRDHWSAVLIARVTAAEDRMVEAIRVRREAADA